MTYILSNQCARGNERFPTVMSQIIVIVKVPLADLLDPVVIPNLSIYATFRRAEYKLTSASSHPSCDPDSKDPSSTPPYSDDLS